MKIGVALPHPGGLWKSYDYALQSTLNSLSGSHDLLYADPASQHASNDVRREMYARTLLTCDVIVGSIDHQLLAARSYYGSRVPYLCILFGNLSRGAGDFVTAYRHLDTHDVLVGNCRADEELARKLFRNAHTACVPFVVDEQSFYPVTGAEKTLIREGLGIAPDERVVLYAGRIALEKNLHTVLRVFRGLQAFVPRARLVIAGWEDNRPFLEFGVFARGITRLLQRAIRQLGIKPESVIFTGPQDVAGLRGLYNIADVSVNLTLNHDENFGLSQVESLACGTPVIGTDWGGLKDTISDLETGYKVRTRVTRSGAKVAWWEAVERITALLNNPEAHAAMRSRCVESFRQSYRNASCGRRWDKLLASLSERVGDKRPLELTEFGRRLWSGSEPSSGNPRSGYRRGQGDMELYMTLIADFCSGKSAASEVLTWVQDDMICLCSPVEVVARDMLEIRDPIFPLPMPVPPGFAAYVYAALAEFAMTAVVPLRRLQFERAPQDVSAALGWMFEAGLIMNCRPVELMHDAPVIDGCVNGLLGSIRAVPEVAEADILVFR